MKTFTLFVKLLVCLSLAVWLIIGAGYLMAHINRKEYQRGVEAGRMQIHNDYCRELVDRDGAPLLLYWNEPKEFAK